VTVSLEALVPADNFYRHRGTELDLGTVRDGVRERYADRGRSSIDPVVFFKLQLVVFFEGLRSERQLMQVVADRLSLRWYLGYDLTEPLPDHSSLLRIRERSGLEICFIYRQERYGNRFQNSSWFQERLRAESTSRPSRPSLGGYGAVATVLATGWAYQPRASRAAPSARPPAGWPSP
jgi:hypothetical protein